MSHELTLHGPTKDFESIKKVTPEGVEYWEARELMPLLGYNKWQNAEKVIGKAKAACDLSGQNVEDHFTDVSKMIILAKNTAKKAQREVKD